jgi:hypothetical protein
MPLMHIHVPIPAEPIAEYTNLSFTYEGLLCMPLDVILQWNKLGFSCSLDVVSFHSMSWVGTNESLGRGCSCIQLVTIGQD